MRIRNFVIVLLSLPLFSSAQDADLPQDYLSKEFHATRRDSLRNRMPDNSVTVVFSYPVRNFSNDVDYIFHQNPDMYYFSGYKEPNSMLLIFKEPQQTPDGKMAKDILFVQKKRCEGRTMDREKTRH